MKRFAFYLGIITALVASCSTQEDDKIPQQDDLMFYASLEQPAEEEGTRLYADDDLHLRWNADDRISIFNRNTYNQQCRFTGETGDNAGGFDKVAGPEFMTGNEISHIVAVYPYLSYTRISESETITLTLPTEQHYAENTFGLGANTMVSVTDDGFLRFKNVGGYLRLRLYGDGLSLSSITLKGNNGEKLAGKATVTMQPDGIPIVTLAEDATNQITLVCDTPVTLGATAEEGKDFWLVVPPVTFSKGFTISVAGTGNIFEKSTGKSVTIERSKLSKMSPLEIEIGTSVEPVPQAIDLGLPSGLKWASFNLGASRPEEYGNYYAWGETQTKTDYSYSSYKWCNGDYLMTKYCPVDKTDFWNGAGSPDGKTVLDPKDDAARMNLGGKWRIPADWEWEELREHCTWTWTTQRGIKGQLVTAKNGNSIFLPAAGGRIESGSWNAGSFGYYWESSISLRFPTSARAAAFGSNIVGWDNNARIYGNSIRPVQGDRPVSVSKVVLSQDVLELQRGETTTLTATVFPENASCRAVTWKSSDESIATVSPSGVVTAVSNGTVTITCTTVNVGYSASCTVSVSGPPEAVYLGLSVKWASFNLGALKPEEYGDYYAWGETEPHYISLDPLIWKEGKEAGYEWASYKWCMGSGNSLTKYCGTSSYGDNGFVDGKMVLAPEDDAAHVNLGENWRIPTDAEWSELRSRCTWEWTTENGVNGFKVTSINGNSIFLPAAGVISGTRVSSGGSGGTYWSSTLPPDYPNFAGMLSFYDGDIENVSGLERYIGFSIRPVYDK